MLSEFFKQRIWRGLVRRYNTTRIAGLAQQLADVEPAASGAPVIFFKASSGIDDLSWNSAFHLLTSWTLRLEGVPVIYFSCASGMSHCVLGTNRARVRIPPPCDSCLHQSRTLYAGGTVEWFHLDTDPELSEALQGLKLPDLLAFDWDAGRLAGPTGRPSGVASARIPLGELCLPSLRWILRRHHLADDEDTCFLAREYMESAWNVARKFASLLERVTPRAVVVFNGQFYPEAAVRFVARQRGIKVVTHEVGLQPASAFFTEGDATAYPIRIPDNFELDPAQNARLDAYLSRRFQGDFTMAGIRFWPEMRGLDEELRRKIARFHWVVPIFTNVVFDTSQPHANTVFESMFGWLDLVLGIIRAHPETLFVVRAHPDELRVRKASRETVESWVEKSGAGRLPNVHFVGPLEPLSSYELINRSKFVMVYNSTIALEASIMGTPVLCGGRARFTQYETVLFPSTKGEYSRLADEMLNASHVHVPPRFRQNARRFLYYQLFRASLPFDAFLFPSVRTTQARLRRFGPAALRRGASPALDAFLAGILDGGDFLLREAELTSGTEHAGRDSAT